MILSIEKFTFSLTLLVFISSHLGTLVQGFIDPIEIKGKQFVRAVGREPFYIKGVDYQPGGSSAVTHERDPLSNSNECARDIVLFQELGINTIRIYSINPDLDHDKCMSMLALAGIYVILDVNSPLQNQHLNRYEPWTTYNPEYLEHIFKVLEHFSSYNNTLGFFAGNEVVNDRRSAQVSPPYIKALVGDMKTYTKKHFSRPIPIGYSAADDLDYRVPLSSYLECSEESSDDYSVDFYGVNSYQWCGQQTMESSGYDQLVQTYKNYSKPVFFSEFGCNRVLPRAFDEIDALFSREMYTTFSGGLVYEFSQESNNYGLVHLDSDGNAQMLRDFDSLKKHYTKVEIPSEEDVARASAEDPELYRQSSHFPYCKNKYENLNINSKVTRGLSKSMISKGVDVNKGKYVDLDTKEMSTTYKILDVDGTPWEGMKKIKVVENFDEPEEEEVQEEHDDQDNGAALQRISYGYIAVFVIINIIYHFII